MFTGWGCPPIQECCDSFEGHHLEPLNRRLFSNLKCFRNYFYVRVALSTIWTSKIQGSKSTGTEGAKINRALSFQHHFLCVSAILSSGNP